MKKNDKIKIVLCVLIFTMIITWFLSGGTFDASGTFEAAKMTRGGIFDIILALMYSFYYKIHNVFFLFTVGGVYGVLSQTKSYRKLVDKTVNLIKGKETLFFLLTTFLIGLFTSLCDEIMVILMFIPFIVSVFLRCSKDRITALSAGIGGIYTKGIGFKIAFFVIAYVLYNLFAIVHMNKQKKPLDETEYDPFLTEELVEEKKKKKVKMWPTITMIILLIIVTILAYINWKTSFGIELFEKIEKGFEELSIKGIPILYSIAGSTSAFGNWNDLMGASAILIITTIVISLTNKLSLDEFIENYIEGMKKVIRIVVMYGLIYAIFVVVNWYGWPTTIINTLIGSGKFNIITMLIAAIVASFYFIENNYTGYILGEFIKNNFEKNALAVTLMFNSTFGVLTAILPTGFITMLGLTALDISYKSWVKYIWKFVLSMLVVIVLIICIMVYM